MPGTLYVVATPIGNLGDMTKRAADALSEADIVAAEDTRVSVNILRSLGLQKRMVSCHKFNEAAQLDMIISQLLEGKNVALVSDAGTPCISDPGSLLVAAAAKAGITVTGVCGACAAVTAVSVSGFDSTSFSFYGFFPRQAGDIRKALEDIKRNEIPMTVWYESPKRIVKAMEHIAESIPDSEICLCNDLTKLFERIYRGSPAKVLEQLRDNPSAEKGEYTIVIYHKANEPERKEDALSAEAVIVDMLVKEGITVKEAVARAAKRKDGYGRKELYAASLRLRELFGDIYDD